MRVYFLVLFFLSAFTAFSQGPEVPAVMDFAGMKLHINSAARRQIQTDVDNLRRSETYFRKKVQKVDAYFPIIERVFKEEKLPDDFKYLVIQESALVSDAVSSSNAVGFWQFKKETGLEMGLRIDNMVDERLNIVASSRAAAGYMKKNNFYFDNWIYALLAYNTGRGGAAKHVKEKDFGKKNMDITASTHWYVKKFLAHKVAFENELRKTNNLPFFLFEYTDGEGKDLKDISREFDVDYDLLAEYNKCYKKNKIPTDKNYTVIVPIGFERKDLIAQNKSEVVVSEEKLEKKEEKAPNSIFSTATAHSNVKTFYTEDDMFPAIKYSGSEIVKVNGKKGVIAKSGDNFDRMAVKGGISLDKFLNVNDLTSYDKTTVGTAYYFQKKRNKARTHYHTLKPGQTLWDVSQKYGIKLKKLMSKNRLEHESQAKPGLVLWLRYIRPGSIPPEYRSVKQYQLQEQPIAEKKKAETPNVHTVVVEKEIDKKSKENQIEWMDQDSPEISESDKTNHIEVFGDSENDRMNRKQVLANQSFENEEEKSNENIEYRIKNHLVQKGDTYFSISKTYGVDIVDLLKWNDLTINQVLSVGQNLVIKLPIYEGNSTIQDPAMTNSQLQARLDQQIIIHKVSDKDTLYGIAKKYQVTIKEIMEWNNMEDFVIKQDEELKIFLK